MESKSSKSKALKLEKGRRGIHYFIFGRTLIIMMLVAIQILLLIWMFGRLGVYIEYVYGGYVTLSAVIVLIVINRQGKNPSVNLSWVILILIVPVVGGLLYLYVEIQIADKIMNRKIQKIQDRTKQYLPQNEEIISELKRNRSHLANLAVYMYRNGTFPVSYAADVEYFPSGEEKFEKIVKLLKEAKHFIFLEYFIIKNGKMWDDILEILAQKASEGVEVRVMYDGMCSLAKLPFSYPKQLKAMGIRCKMFDPIYPMVSTHYNNRDHRKILVIDGKYAFTGGINLSDEYININSSFGHWKDTAVMMTGEAVKSFTMMFLQMWNIDSKQEENYQKYINMPTEHGEGKNGYLLPYGDSPLDNEQVGEMVYLDIINRSEKYVHIMTPYLIPDYSMMSALKFAAKRGVDVVLILPHVPDKKYAYALAVNCYKELLTAGVKIYEYTPGFVHAKVFVSDDKKAVVGTINVDYRSFYLNFECGVYMYRVPEISKIEEDMLSMISAGELITLKNYKKNKRLMLLIGKIIKPFAPLM